MNTWTQQDLPAQNGKVTIITGGNSGIGYEAALTLAGKGARVILAVRDVTKGEAAARQICAKHSAAQVTVMSLDLADLKNVRAFARQFLDQYEWLDLLINNAGVMALPKMKTADGFEMQFGTNHLGHFALTGLLLRAWRKTPGARVVTVSSAMHLRGDMRFEDLQSERKYQRWGAYSQSKLANLLFAYELQRKLAAASSPAISVGCHPGYAATNLQTAAPRIEGARLRQWLMQVMNVFAQSAEMGALPILFAAAAAEVNGGDYIGPARGMYGYPVKAKSSAASYDAALAKKLWTVSEELTGVLYNFDL